MLLRSVALALSALLLCAATEPPPPPLLEPYVRDGRFEPGDYRWMKGRFPDATAEEKDAFASLVRWYGECRALALAQLRTDLADAGYPGASIDNLGLNPKHCLNFHQPNVRDIPSFAAFQEELKAAEPVANTYLAVVRMAEEAARPSSPDLGRMLEARPLGEQLLRSALTWGQGLRPDSPELSPAGRALFQAEIASAIGAYDHANTEWLKGIVAEHGWPKISKVGERASMSAWLMAQHADNDPLFQLEVLRLIEPLVAQGEVSKRNYAYLYDRVMLKLRGKQRYATQMMCDGDVRRAQPLEDEAEVNRLRAEMDLGTVEDYIAMMDRSAGTCAALTGGAPR